MLSGCRVFLININDAPVLAIGDDDKSSNYSEGDAPLIVSPLIEIMDSDDTHLEWYLKDLG